MDVFPSTMYNINCMAFNLCKWLITCLCHYLHGVSSLCVNNSFCYFLCRFNQKIYGWFYGLWQVYCNDDDDVPVDDDDDVPVDDDDDDDVLVDDDVPVDDDDDGCLQF